jgi:diguanylate cyclase (GGDEF)-like protein
MTRSLKELVPLLNTRSFMFTGIATTLVIGVVIGLGWSMSRQVAQMDTEFHTQYSQAARELDDITSLLQSRAYGAFIQNYNNYILRRDQTYLTAARADIRDVLSSLDRLDAAGSGGFQQPIETLRRMFQTYHRRLGVVERLVAEGASIEEINQTVSGPEDPAIVANAMLTHEFFGKMSAYQSGMQENITRLQGTIAIGAALIVPIIALGAFILAIQLSALRDAADARSSARLDPLTKLRDRWAFSEDTAGWFGPDGDPSLAIAVLDIDRFRPLLATRGRVAADLALMRVGDIIADVCGDRAITARLEVDRFAIAIPPSEDADALTEEIRARIERASLKQNDEEFTVTVSVGLQPNRHESLMASLDAAGSAMKLSRRLGGNCISYGHAIPSVASASYARPEHLEPSMA